MANLWEKVKQTLEEGAKAVKEGAESVAKTVAEKAPQIAATIAEKSQEIAVSISDKTQEMVTLGQLKVKQYNLSRDVSNLFTDIGGQVFELIKKHEKNIYSNPDIMKMIEDVKKLEVEIEEVEKKMEEVRAPKPAAEGEKSEKTEKVAPTVSGEKKG
ncbi:MAG: hypothetical protein JSW07_20160 [bacterium]|nr:MAG: hypothetical protein JSW07_20160 [bacterium]